MLIGEVARRSGVSARMLRHYDTLGLVRPTGRTVGGYRSYTPDDIRRIFHVEGLRSLGLSLRQIGRALDDPAFTPAALVGDLIARAEERLRRERELLDRLRTVDAAGPADWQHVARVVELLHGLGSPSAERRQQAVLAPADPLPAERLAEAVLTESDPFVAGALRWALARATGDGSAGPEATTSVAGGSATAEPATSGAPAAGSLAGGSATSGSVAVEPATSGHPAAGSQDAGSATHGSRAAGSRAASPAVTGLARGLAHDDPEVRRRAVLALGELPGDEVIALLTGALDDTDPVVRRRAALALGARGVTAAAPTLLSVVTDGPNDVEAAELLGALARDPAQADRIMAALTTALAAPGTPTAVRMRLTQALAEMPGAIALDLLRQLTRDAEHPVALLATALTTVIEARPA